jgi:exopolysaccharide production protein ExoZ
LRQIASIQSLRAFAALIVVVGHAQTEAIIAAAKQGVGFVPLSVLPWGAGVDLFFVISGFIMVVASERLFAAPGGANAFATRRLKRIVPLYWLFTTLYVLIQFATHKSVDAGSLAASYLFWPHDTYGDGALRPIFALGWTLNYEMVFYALFSLAVLLPRRRAVALVAGLLVVGVAIGQVVAIPSGPLAFWTQPIVLEFALGMGIGLAWREGVRLGVGPRILLALGGLLLLVYDTMGSAHQASTWITPTDLGRLAGWGLPAAALLSSAALARKPTTSGFLGTVALGDASYALYLVHPFVVGPLMRAWALTGLAHQVGYWPFVVISLVVSIAAALAVHRWFELPIARGLALRRIDGRPTGNAAATP